MSQRMNERPSLGLRLAQRAAFITAVVGSAVSTTIYCLYGYLPEGSSERAAYLHALPFPVCLTLVCAIFSAPQARKRLALWMVGSGVVGAVIGPIVASLTYTAWFLMTHSLSGN